MNIFDVINESFHPLTSPNPCFSLLFLSIVDEMGAGEDNGIYEDGPDSHLRTSRI